MLVILENKNLAI